MRLQCIYPSLSYHRARRWQLGIYFFDRPASSQILTTENAARDQSIATMIELQPIAGFCIKTTTEQSAIYTPLASPKPQNVLEPLPSSLPIPKGLKIFVNIAWDPNVPPPPLGNEQAIQRAMHGHQLDQHDSDAWYVPVVISHGRQDRDKGHLPQDPFPHTFLSFDISRQAIPCL